MPGDGLITSPGGVTPGPRRPLTVLLDGRSGAGKTTLATRLAAFAAEAGWAASAPRVVHLDDFYPGWSGLAAAREIVADSVLATDPARAGFHRWDWQRGRRGEWVPVDPGEDLIVEGVGALSPRSLRAARERSGERVLSVFVDADAEQRRARALRRDPYFAGWWEMWAEQETAHLAQCPEPDLRVDTSAG